MASKLSSFFFFLAVFFFYGAAPSDLAGEVLAAVPAPTSALTSLDTLHLQDQNARRFNTARVAGKVVLLNFVFTRCSDTCPVQTEQFAQLQRAMPRSLRDKVVLVSVSVDPDRDTPAALKRYAHSYGADEASWIFLTGKPTEVAVLTRTFDAVTPLPTSVAQARHSSDARLFDARGRAVQRYSGVHMDRERVLRELEAVSHTAAESR